MTAVTLALDAIIIVCFIGMLYASSRRVHYTRGAELHGRAAQLYRIAIELSRCGQHEASHIVARHAAVAGRRADEYSKSHRLTRKAAA